MEDMELDLTDNTVRQPIQALEPIKKKTGKIAKVESIQEDELVSCLRNEKVVVRYLPRETGLVSNPKHIFYGGMAENAVRIFTVPILESTGAFVNVLTNTEKAFLEAMMGLEVNALSIYQRENNFWTNYSVRLTKSDNYLDLSNPEDYIKYKVLIANKDFIAASLADLQEKPRATYQFVIISENDETKEANKQLNASMEAYMLLGKHQEDKELLKFVAETIDGRPISAKADLTFITGAIQKIIQANPKTFISLIKDPYLTTKVLIQQSVEAGLIRKRGDYLYLAADNSPLCGVSEDPTLNVAAKYLNAPKNQEIKFTLEAKLKTLKD